MPTVKEIMAFFFKAMVNGYASGSSKLKIHDLPGYKGILFREGKFILLDMWHTTPGSNKSSGTTTIWYGDVVVWVMHYGGWYEESVIPFLKRALMRNYEDGIFLGGRGPTMIAGDNHTVQYINTIERNDLANFRGHEVIVSISHFSGFPEGRKLGEHEYFGMLTMEAT